MAWTDERVERLKKMWLDGASASQIAAELGDVTRNAVIGKVHRLGLSGRGKPTTTTAPKARKPRSTAPASRRPSATRPVSIGATALKASPDLETAAEIVVLPSRRADIELVELGESPRLTIHQLTEATCKFPIGDPTERDFHFCGREANVSAPYCAYHCRIAYQAPAERRREKRA
ncbi:MAG: GcrA cell cycle regulator [Hyphomicrobiaceae bacterium]|nr:GcrA cell cycle regulator [Hyphomicrobiaceae bacterium]